MSHRSCIPDDVLPALASGTLSDDDAAPWELHLLECKSCQERTQSINQSDTIVAALRRGQSHVLSAEAAAAVEGLIERLVDREHLSAAATPTSPSLSTETPTAPHATEPTSLSSEPTISADTLVGPYRITKKLGEGGMGAVYLATHTRLQKSVALKLLPEKLTSQPGAIARFEREMRAVGKLNHPHIVQAYDAGEVGGCHYLAMEYIAGSDLHVLVKQRGPMSIVNACKAARQTAMALAAAHDAGLVHRDLKPSNLLVAPSGQVKLLDLGLALLADESAEVTELTSAGQTFGTPDYMAPEQWEDSHAADARTDLYALGCTLYFLLVGYPPYGTDRYRSAVAKMKGHVNDPIPDLKAARPDVPDDVVAIYQRLMAKNPADRFVTANEVVQALAPFVSSRRKPEPAAPTAVPATSGAAGAHTTVPSGIGSGSPPKKRRWMYSAAAAGGFLLLAVIVITITGNDGKRTSITAPDGIPVDIKVEPGSKISITQTSSPPDQAGIPQGVEAALAFDGVDDHMEIPRLMLKNEKPITVEAWLTPQTWKHCAIINISGKRPISLYLDEGTVGFWCLGSKIEMPAPANLVGQRIHVAGVYDEQNLTVYLNGQPSAQVKPLVSEGGEPLMASVGAIRDWENNFLSLRGFFHGQLHAIRVSESVRYTAPFKPPRQLITDAETLACYQFHSGRGDTVADLSGNKFDGKVLGAQWVASASTGGWHGWPSDAPKPAIAPFDAAQAKKHQEEWAAYLNAPVEYTNSIGMRFRLIPPGEFLMGATVEDAKEIIAQHPDDTYGLQKRWMSSTPRRKVALTRAFYLAVTEVTQEQYQKVMGVNPSLTSESAKDQVEGVDTSRHPVTMVSLPDAAQFCMKLSDREQFSPCYVAGNDAISQVLGEGYRLPTEAEWEYACRAGTETPWFTGDEKSLKTAAWYGANGGIKAHPVGKLKSNPYGLYDMHGNAWEICHEIDFFFSSEEVQSLTTDPLPSPSMQSWAIRGGNFYFNASFARSDFHNAGHSRAFPSSGFRVSLPISAVQRGLNKQGAAVAKLGWQGWPADAPNPAIAPFDAAQAKKHQEEWAAYLKVPVEYTNTLGMKFRLIPPGEFLMGSTTAEIEQAQAAVGDHGGRRRHIRSEGPQHKVILTRPFYLGVNETTQAEYEKAIGSNPSAFAMTGTSQDAAAEGKTPQYPVEQVSYYDAIDFCIKLSTTEEFNPFYIRAGESVTVRDGTGYRLPTEAEWEFACRAGTTTSYWSGNTDAGVAEMAWFDSNSEGRTHAVGERKDNPFGLYDINGNVWEWVQDAWGEFYYSEFERNAGLNPTSSVSTDSQYVIRGGAWSHIRSDCRAAYRDCFVANNTSPGVGFRTSLSVDAVRQALKKESTPLTKTGWPADAPKPAIAP